MTVSTPPRRNLPYLQRTWKQGISGATSGATRQPGSRNGVNGVDAGHEDRPLKRFKLAGDVTPNVTQPPSRNAFPPSPPYAPRSLRINVIKLAHKESEKRVKPNRTLNNIDGLAHHHDQETITRAACKITVLDGTPLYAHRPPVVYCVTQDCTIRTFKSPHGSGPVGRVHLDEPFLIPEKSLWVPREDSTRGLAENYRLDVELFAGDFGDWPPLEVSIPTGPNSQGSKSWVLFATLDNLFERRTPGPDIYLHQYTRERMLDTDFVADIDVKWSTGLADRQETPEDMMNTITVADTGGVLPAVRHANAFVIPEDMVNGDGRNGSRQMSEEFDGETTPNRALRTRGNTVYNLKKLSDKAHGKGKKKSQQSDRDDGYVTYLLPEMDHLHLDSYRCFACGEAHRSVKVLQVHMELRHAEYKCDLRSGGAHQFRVTHNYDCPSPPAEEFQFTAPADGLDLDKIVRGKGRAREEEPAVQGPIQPRTPAPKRRCEKPKIMVPHTGQPMYDPVSRAMLEPGTELVAPSADDSWRIQKHRDNIADYVDIPTPEREYISAWDAFSLPRGLSSEVYLPGMLMDFAREKAAWLVASEQRMEEFLKHLASLQLRGVTDQRTMEEVLGVVGEARGEREREWGGEPMDEDGAAEWQASRGAENCVVCGQAATSIVCVLACSNAACKRHFHLSCIREDIKVDPLAERWLCNDCAPDPPRRRGRSPVSA